MNHAECYQDHDVKHFYGPFRDYNTDSVHQHASALYNALPLTLTFVFLVSQSYFPALESGLYINHDGNW